MRFGGSSGFAAPIAWHSIIGLILALPPEVYDDVVHASIEAAFCELGLQAFRNEGGVNAIGSAGGSALPPALCSPASPPAARRHSRWRVPERTPQRRRRMKEMPAPPRANGFPPIRLSADRGSLGPDSPIPRARPILQPLPRGPLCGAKRRPRLSIRATEDSPCSSGRILSGVHPRSSS